MMPRFFNSLRGQLVTLIVAALIVAQAASLWLFVDERGLAVRAALGFEAADRAANVALLIEQAPQDLRPAILRAANSPLVRFNLSDGPSVDHVTHADTGAVAGRVRTLLGDSNGREIRVEIHEVDHAILPMPHMPPRMMDMHATMMRDRLSTIEMQLSIALIDGTWLNVGTRFERPPLQWSWLPFASFVVTAAAIVFVACWFLLARLTGPLLQVSRAADRLGRGEDIEPLPLTGPDEVRNLTQAFNRMQDRLTRFIADRTQLLAALGHDLRSPLTALRVRAEMVEEDETRDAMIRSVTEMQDMVDATLAFARGIATTEPYEMVDLGAYLTRLQSDMMDAFSLAGDGGVTLGLRPKSMRRALRNIIENAQQYGGGAHVSYGRRDEFAVVTVSDTGPGIPDADLDQVFEPFFRLEQSRSRTTGGTGLGLSIARTIVRAHGGDIVLSNRPGGGLDAVVTLPLVARSQPDGFNIT